MKRRLIILLILIPFNIIVRAENTPSAQSRRFTYGIEWNYVGTFHSAFHYNFFSLDGYRYNFQSSSLGWHSNADMYIHGGMDFKGGKENLSLYIGLAGIGDFHKAVPMTFRYTWFFKENLRQDRWMMFVDAGSGICLKKEIQEILTGRIGGGYRLSLSKTTKLDFLLSARITYTHPQILFEGENISLKSTNRNNALLSAISLGIAITL